MWRKPEATEPNREQTPNPTPSRPVPSAGSPAGERAVIGASISIHGDVTGEEDLLIQGRVDGKVDLKQHNVTVGERGRIKADVYGRSLVVEGRVEGNLVGEERVVVRQSGTVIGNITAPRVTLEDGATFKGSIDMDSKGRGTAKGGSAQATQPDPPAKQPDKPAPAAGDKDARPKAAAGGGA